MLRGAAVMALAYAAALGAQAARAPHAARVEGQVADSLRGGVLVGASVVATPLYVTMDTVFHAAITDSVGHFVLDALPPGDYSLSVDHPLIDSTGIGASALTVTVLGDETVHVVLAIPSALALRRLLCAAIPMDSTEGVMLGTVRRADGPPLVNGTVVFTWADFVIERFSTVHPRELTASVRTDSLGTYRACGLPIQRSLFVQAQGEPGAQSGIVEEQIDAGGVLRRDLSISTPDSAPAVAPAAAMVPATTGAAPAARGLLLTGRVLTADETPIASAQVSLLGTAHAATTNERGEFRMANVPAGTQGLRVIALGYLPLVRRVDVVAGVAPVVVQLENVAVVLDSMQVIAKRTSRPGNPMTNGFEHRRHLGNGTFLTQGQIEATHGQVVTDVMRHVSGVHLATPRGAGSEIVVSNRGPVTFTGGPTVCPLDVYIDGIQVRPEDINLVPPGALHGMEVHSVATMPPQYKSGNCGAVFLWTR